MRVTMTCRGRPELQKYLKNLSTKRAKEVKQETYASGLDIAKEAKEKLKEMGAWDLGNLANSILAERIEGGKAAEVGPTAPYGAHVEYGTKPHFPPPKALEGWAKRHGFDSAWPICKAIARRGLQARPFLLPAYLAVVDKYFHRLREIFRK